MLATSHIPAPRPDGRLDVTITYLEMLAAPQRPFRPTPSRKLALLRAEPITVHFYRYLYDTVGEPWLWYERRVMSDAALGAIVRDPRIEIYVLYAGGVPAGYAELDRRKANEIELAYFGMMPEFIGQGLGGYLLDRAIGTAWGHAPKRLWVHTCNLDHPRALQTYQKSGFVPYKQVVKTIDDPRAVGILPASD